MYHEHGDTPLDPLGGPCPDMASIAVKGPHSGHYEGGRVTSAGVH